MRSTNALLALALLNSSLTQAQSAEIKTPETRTLETIRVEATVESTSSAAKLPLSLRETPQSITVITSERIEAQNLTSLQDVLDNTPGVYTYAWDTERVLFTSRGFLIDNLMYDGVPAETSFSTHSVDETLDTALYDRIEIVRGATGLMTGAGSPAASINLLRKHADSRTLTSTLGLTVGSWDDRRFDVDVAMPLTSDGSVRARFVGVYQDADSFQSLYSKEKKVFYGIVDADLSDATKLSVGVDFQDNKPRSNTWGSFPLFLGDGSLANWSRSVTTATDWSFWDRKKKSAFAEVTHTFDSGWTLRSSLNWRRFEEDLALFYVYGFPDPQTGEGLEPFAYRSDGRITELALDLHATGSIELFGREHELVVGYNGSKVRNTGNEYTPGEMAPVGNFFEWDGSYPEPVFDDGFLLTNIDSRQNGWYAAGRFVLAEPLKAIAGVRYGTWKTDHFYYYDSPDVTFHDDYEKVIPYAGLIFDVSNNYSLFASYTEIFKPQTSREVTGKYLDPIDGNSVEVGIKGEHFDRRLNTSLTLFETKQDNVATAAINEETGEPILLDDGAQASVAIDGTRTRGFEFETFGELTPGWTGSLGWTRYQIEDADGAAVRAFVPRTLIRAFTTWTPAALTKLTIGGGVNWQSDSSTLVGAPDGGVTLRVGSVTQVSLMARYQFTPKISAQVNGSNLLDKKYYVLDDYDNTHYGEPLSVSASLNWSF